MGLALYLAIFRTGLKFLQMGPAAELVRRILQESEYVRAD